MAITNKVQQRSAISPKTSPKISPKISPVISSAILTASLITSGCSSSSSSDNSATLTQFGIFTLDEFDAGAFGSNFLIAGFFDLPDDIAPFLPLFETPTSDFCIANGELTPEGEEIDSILNDGVQISAGDTLVLSSPLGTFATLDKRDDDQGVFYTSADMLDNIPADLTLDIPGDTFPAFANVAVPDSISIDDFDYSTDNITAASVYTWTPTGSANSFLYLDMSFGSTLIECQVVDDGNFSLPEETVAQVGELTDGTVENASIDTSVLVQSGNALLRVTRTKEISLPE